jgi:prevent-host-death family protein
MRVFNIHDAKTQFSKLVDAVTQGEEILIVRAGEPAAMLVPIPSQKAVRQPGAMKDMINIADDFDAPLPDDRHAAFEGR